MFKLPRLVVVVGWLLCAGAGGGSAYAMGSEEFGPADDHMSRMSDWPKGVEETMRHSSRVYCRNINGSENAFFDGDIRVVNELVELYSQVDLAKHPVLIYSGRPTVKSFNSEKSAPYVVEFVVPGSFVRLGMKQQMASGIDLTTPRLVVHVDDKLVEQLDELKVPANVTLYNRDTVTDDPEAQELQQRVDEFLNAHPQSASVPTPEAVFAAMQKADAEYEGGFTARGARLENDLSGHGRLGSWTVTMGRDRIVVEQRDVEDDTHPKVAGRFESTIYAGPDRMGWIDASRGWGEGKLIDSEPTVMFEPVGPAFDLLIGRCLWPLGRGLSSRIDRVHSVKQEADGLLRVQAGEIGNRWELVVDPQNDYLVREAKAFRAGDAQPVYVIETAGVLSGGGRSVAHTARWIEGRGEPVSIAVTSVSAKADEELVQRTENRLDELQAVGR
jgi:hypothetical protein